MLKDFFFIHADVLRNTFVLFCWSAGLVLVTTIANRFHYRKRAIREASEHLKQRLVEALNKEEVALTLVADLTKTIERLTVIQGTAHAAAKSISEAVEAKE